jgi:hypothetical protein
VDTGTHNVGRYDTHLEPGRLRLVESTSTLVNK